MRAAVRAVVFVAATLVIAVEAFNAWWDVMLHHAASGAVGGWVATVTQDYPLPMFVAFLVGAGALTWVVGRYAFPTRHQQLTRPD